MLPNNFDDVIEKIKKLLALTENSNEFEAQSAARKANELLQKYNLEMADIENINVDRDKVTSIDLETDTNYTAFWRSVLLQIIAKYNFCRSIKIMLGRASKLKLVGKPSNMEIVILLYNNLSFRFESICEREWMAHKKIAHAEGIDGRKYKKAWLVGAVHGLKLQFEESQQQFQQANKTGRELLVLRQQEITKHMIELGMIKLSKRNKEKGIFHTRVRNLYDAAFENGTETGKNIQFQNFVEPATKETLYLE